MSMIPATANLAEIFTALAQEQEILTQETWDELFSKSKKCVPGLLVGLIHCSSGKIAAYDGIALKKYLRVNKNAKDPTTNLPIEKVHYLYVKTFNFDKEEAQEIEAALVDEEQLTPALRGLQQYYETGLNFHGFINSQDEKVKNLIAQSQYIIGFNLFSADEKELKEEGIRWLTCSANNQCTEAAKLLTHFYERGVVVPKNNLKAKYFSEKGSNITKC